MKKKFFSVLLGAALVLSGCGDDENVILPPAVTSQVSLLNFQPISIIPGGATANGISDDAGISGAGQFITFESEASNLVVPTTSGVDELFLFDRQNGVLERLSEGLNGANPDGNSDRARVSTDGRFVVFRSVATNLVANDGNGVEDVFLLDRSTNTRERVSVDTNGGDADAASFDADLSDSGRFVSFASAATDIVAGGNGGNPQVYLRDRQAGTITLVSKTAADAPGNAASAELSISSNGDFIAFSSAATNLVANDTNAVPDIFVYNRQADTVERISVATGGAEGNGESITPAISADGRYVAFESDATNLVTGDANGNTDIFLHDRQTGTTTLVSVATGGGSGNGDSTEASITNGGGFVSFSSDATDLVANDTNGFEDVFVRSIPGAATILVSRAQDGSQGNGDSDDSILADDGSFIVYETDANNIIPNDGNGVADVLVVRNPFQL